MWGSRGKTAVTQGLAGLQCKGHVHAVGRAATWPERSQMFVWGQLPTADPGKVSEPNRVARALGERWKIRYNGTRI